MASTCRCWRWCCCRRRRLSMVSVPAVTSNSLLVVMAAPWMALAPVESTVPALVMKPPVMVAVFRSRSEPAVAVTSIVPLVGADAVGDGEALQLEGAAVGAQRAGVGDRAAVDLQFTAGDLEQVAEIVGGDDAGEEARPGGDHRAVVGQVAAGDGGGLEVEFGGDVEHLTAPAVGPRRSCW